MRDLEMHVAHQVGQKSSITRGSFKLDLFNEVFVLLTILKYKTIFTVSL